MRPKNTAARSLAKSPAAPALASVPYGPPPTVESLGQQLRDVLPTRRLHSISVCDQEANVLWLSEGALGPDEHVVILEAIEQLASDAALPCHETGLEDGRLAVFLPVRAPTGLLVGVAMILADSKSVGDDTIERMTAAPVRTIMHRLAVLMKPGESADGAVPKVQVETESLDIELELTEVVSMQAPPPEPAPAAVPPRDFSPLELAARHAPQKPQAPVVTPRRDLSPLEIASRNSAPEPKAPPGLEPADLAILDLVPIELAPEPEAQPSEPPPEENPPASEPISAEAVNDILEFELILEAPRDAARPAAAPAPRPAPPKPPARSAARAAPHAPAKAPAPPIAADPAEDSGVGMVHLEFLPEPPVVNAPPPSPAPVARRPSIVPEPAPAAPPTPRPARVLAPPEPRAQRPAASAAAPSAGAARSGVFVPPMARVPTTARGPATPAPVAAPAAAPAPASAPAAAAAAPSPGDAGLPLEVLPFVKLRAGGQTRRFQVQPRGSAPPRDPATLDALVLQRLLGWLAAHRSAWNSQPTSFTLNLSVTTLEDERFLQKIAAALNANGMAADTLGFEIAEPLCAQRRAQVERFIGQCEQLGTWIAIDDFSFDSQVLPLLRSKATRLVKINPRLTSAALRDKLSQGIVVATVQAAKVLGIHCSAKKVDSPAQLQWLTAIGCDFAQGAAVARALPLEGLAALSEPKGAPSPAA